MADRDSVETHLMIIHTWASFALEKDINFLEPAHFRDIIRWTDDAIKLLREYEKTKAVFKRHDGQIETECENCRQLLDKFYSHCPRRKEELD